MMRGVASFGEDEDNKERVNQSMTRRSRRQDLIIIYIYSYYRLHYTYTDTYRVILICTQKHTIALIPTNKKKTTCTDALVINVCIMTERDGHTCRDTKSWRNR